MTHNTRRCLINATIHCHNQNHIVTRLHSTAEFDYEAHHHTAYHQNFGQNDNYTLDLRCIIHYYPISTGM